MKTTLLIWLCKIITKICHIFGKQGSVYPGSIINKFDNDILNKLNYPKYVIAVTGSSGKGSTVNMLAHILKENNKNFIWNNNGSNVKNAIITLILNNTSAFSKNINTDIVLLEMDERYIKETFNKGIITHMLITNITRDQPARNIHPDVIFDAIMSSLNSKTHVIINVDDPILNKVKDIHKGKITTYGIDENKYSLKTIPPYSIDAQYCPNCHSKLKYSSYHYGHLGNYTCPKCDFKRGVPDYTGSKVDLNKGTFKLNGITLKLNKKVFFAVYYTIGAYVLSDLIGIEKKDIIDSININMIESKRMKTYSLDGRNVELIESKNENSLSYLQSLNYIKSKSGKKTVILGFENVSRRYSYNDLSWLWDVNFELLKDEDIDKIFVIGRFKYDIATRLDYAGIDKNKIYLVEELDKLLEIVKSNSKGDIYTMVCFDMTEYITNLLKEENHEED